MITVLIITIVLSVPVLLLLRARVIQQTHEYVDRAFGCPEPQCPENEKMKEVN